MDHKSLATAVYLLIIHVVVSVTVRAVSSCSCVSSSGHMCIYRYSGVCLQEGIAQKACSSITTLSLRVGEIDGETHSKLYTFM